MRLLPYLAGIVAASLLTPNAAVAQVTTADIIGRVTDATGAVVPNAIVTIQSQATGQGRSMPTNEAGDYAFNFLAVGPYAIWIELSGFGTQTAAVTVAAGDRARVDVRLALGVEETIDVTAEAARALHTDSSAIGTLISLKEVQDLPVNGRNFVRLLQTLPGAHEGMPNSLASGTRPDDRRQTSAVSMRSPRGDQLGYPGILKRRIADVGQRTC